MRWSRIGIAAGAVLAAAQAASINLSGAWPLCDDAYISLRYGQNLAAGRGLVFNPGEHVEGFTNPLWTLLCAAVEALHLPPVPSLKVAGFLSLLLLIAALGRAAEDLRLPPLLAVGLPLLGGATSALVYWTQTGLETVAFAAVLLAGTRRIVAASHGGDGRLDLGGNLLLGVAALLRPEAVALWAIVTGVSLAHGRLTEGRWPRLGWAWLGFVLPVLLWQVLRLRYYGEWLPNTFYAKVGGPSVLTRGLLYLQGVATETPLVLLLLGALAAPTVWRRQRLAAACGAVGLFMLAYIARVGGDYMPLGRFAVPALAPLAVLAAAAVATRGPRLQVLWLVGAVATGLLPQLTGAVRRTDQTYLRLLRASEWLRDTLPAETVVATPAIGMVGYIGQVRVLDMYGLVDKEIARHRDPRFAVVAGAGHDRVAPDLILQRAPDLILLANVWAAEVPMTPARLVEYQDQVLTPTDRYLFGMPEFTAAYEVINYRTAEGYFVGAAVRRDSPLHPDHPESQGPAPALRLPDDRSP